MRDDFFEKLYDPKDFTTRANALVGLLETHLSEALSGQKAQVIHYRDPDTVLGFWRDYLHQGKNSDLFEHVLEQSVHTHNPRYMGHQVGATAPITALTGLLGAFLNNGMAVYEMGMASTAMERVAMEVICQHLGWNDQAGGLLTSGGTLANLTALLAARKAKVSRDVWNEGMRGPLSIMVCEEAHYSVDRAARVMGLGREGIIGIPARTDFSMDVSLLEHEYAKALEKGIEVFAIVGSAPSTATGAYDDLEAIARFAQKRNLWFHVDGAHGGAAIFSKKNRYLVSGIEWADSVILDGHKMLMMPVITTAVLFKDIRHSHATFSQTADYLLTDEADWYNGGKRTFECTKTMMSLHWIALLKGYGTQLFERFLDRQYNLAKTFAKLITNHADFELAVPPKSNIVCFRYVSKNLGLEELNQLNLRIREAVLIDGEYYIVQTRLRGIWYLRTTLMNPFTIQTDLEGLLQKLTSFVGTTP